MTWARGSKSSVTQHSGSTTYTPTIGTLGYAVGDLLVGCISARQINSTTISISGGGGWTTLASYTNGGLTLIGKIATSTSETAPLVTLSLNDPSQAQFLYYTGAPGSITGIVDVSQPDENASSSTIPYGPLAMTNDNELVILAWAMRATWTSSSPPSGFAIIQDSPWNNAGATLGFGWADQVQTTETDIASGSISPVGGITTTAVSVMTSLIGALTAVQGSFAEITPPGPGLFTPHPLFLRDFRSTDQPPPPPPAPQTASLGFIPQAQGPANYGPFSLGQMLGSALASTSPPSKPLSVPATSFGFIPRPGPGIGPSIINVFTDRQSNDQQTTPPLIIPSINQGCIRRILNLTIRHR